MATQNPVQNINNWLDFLHQQGKSQHTLDAYRRALHHFADWSERCYGQRFDPAQVMPRDVSDWKRHQQSIEKAKPATINQRLVALNGFLDWCAKQGIIRSNPAAAVTGLTLAGHAPKALDESALRRLLRTVHAGGDLRDIALVETLVGTGLRVSELLALQIEDVTITRRAGHLIVRMGKKGNQRSVPLVAAVRQALSAYLAVHPQRDNPKAKLWQGQRGDLQDRSAVTRVLQGYAQQAQIACFGPHVLRHTFATRYLAANPSDLRGLAALLGHASLNTVMIYTQPSLEDLAERMERGKKERPYLCVPPRRQSRTHR